MTKRAPTFSVQTVIPYVYASKHFFFLMIMNSLHLSCMHRNTPTCRSTMSGHKQAVTHDLLVRELCKVTEWDVLGIYIGLDESEITEIERDHQSNARRRIAMLAKWMEKDVDASWEKVIGALECLSQIRLANQLKEKYCTSESNPPASPAKPAESSPEAERELTVNREDFLEMETLGDKYLQLVMEAESAVEESNPAPSKKLKRFSQCFMSKEILTVDELFDQMKPFYFLEYIMLEKIVKFFLPQGHSVAENLRDYLQQLKCFKLPLSANLWRALCLQSVRETRIKASFLTKTI